MSIKLVWEDMECNFSNVQRAKVFGGWIVRSVQDVLVSLHQDMTAGAGYEWREAMVFVPDPKHEWGECSGPDVPVPAGPITTVD